MIKYKHSTRLLILTWVMVVATVGPLLSAQLQISKNPDFSSGDRVFYRSDVLYIRVSAPEIDYTDIERNELTLGYTGAGSPIEKSFQNRLDGTYETSIDLTNTDTGESEWHLGIRIEDESRKAFRREVEIKIHREGDLKINLRGRIQILSGSALTVKGIEFLLTEETQILEGGLLGGLLSLGLPVEINAFVDVTGKLVATTISILLGGVGSEDEIEFAGEVLGVSSNSIVIQGVTFAVDQETTILDTFDKVIPLNLLSSGFIVEVEGESRQDGSWLASKIGIEDFFHDALELTGNVDAIGDQELVVSGNAVITDAGTAIFDSEGGIIGLQALQAGTLVDIRVDILLDGSLRASEIRIKLPFDDEVELTGIIETVNPGSLLVSGLLINLDDNTTIVDRTQQPITLGSLAGGEIAEVVADKQPGGSLRARKIQLKDKLQDEVELSGAIQGKTANSITIDGLEFMVTPNTAILNNGGAPIDFDNLSTNRVVKIRGDILPDGTWIAIRIELRNRSEKEVDVVGSIDSIASDGLLVFGLWFAITDTTEILNQYNNPINIFSLAAGRNIEVKSTRMAGGRLSAERVTLKDVMILTGTLESVVYNGVSLAGQRILFSSDTMILSKLNEFISSDDLSAGQVVEVRAERFDTTAFATKVKVRDADRVSSVQSPPDAAPFVPSNFVLEQNYPNPFNPTTRIEFRISHPGRVPASLIIYNLMGQKVRLLLDSELSPGYHSVTWDGRDSSGQSLATGVYLYELTVDGTSTVRRMLLMR